MRERLTGTLVLVYTLIMMVFSVITLSPANGQFVNNRKVETIPSFTYYTLEGHKFSNKDLKDNSRLMIVYFNPLCEVCQREMKEILTNMDYFKNMQIVMVSPNSKEEIGNFVTEHNLSNFPQITVLHDVNDAFYKEFHAIGYPSLYLYDENKNLVEHFDSHADIREIKDAYDPQTAKHK